MFREQIGIDYKIILTKPTRKPIRSMIGISKRVKWQHRYKVFYLQMIATMKYRRCNIITEYVQKWETDNI